ncbi:MAG: class I SAM-dependent methyltransferase [Flavobacteriaceae bacterium]|nr:class I SAM-dependent methyltransferase [Flavobacteriaceae bacterium]
MSCQRKKHQNNDKEVIKSEKHEHNKSHGNEANEQMHKTPVAKLIKRFESPERDAYQQPEKVLAYIGDVTNKTILDIGAGSGYFSIRLAKKGAYVIAGDVDDEFLNYIKERVEKEHLDSLIEVRKLPYDSPVLKEEEVDKVLIVNTYHHIEDRSVYFAKVLKGLKQDGELIVIDFFKKDLPIGPPADHKISKEKVLEELKQAGFKDFEVNTELLEMQFIIRAK